MIIVALMLCTTSFIVHAQVEQVAQQLAENEHKKFAEALPDAFTNGRANVFGNAQALKSQFFLEENAKTFADFLGWNSKQYSQKTLGTVFKALSENAKPGKKNPNPISVTFNFPADPTVSTITIKNDQKGTPKVEKKEMVVSYVATTKAEVTVESSKEGVEPSIAYNNIDMIWDGRIRLVNGEVVDTKKISPPVLRTIVISPAGTSSEPKEVQMQARNEEELFAVENKDRLIDPEVTPQQNVVTNPEPAQQQITESVSQTTAPTVTRTDSSPRGVYYKVQILIQGSYTPLDRLPERFRVDNVTVEKYSDGYYKYVIPAGTLSEAVAIRDRMVARGVYDAWIAVYENGVRVRPPQGQPEIVD